MNLLLCTVVVDRYLCKGCAICVDMCPHKALKMSSDVGPRGYHYPVLVGNCRGCRICEMYCPDFAICVICGEDK